MNLALPSVEAIAELELEALPAVALHLAALQAAVATRLQVVAESAARGRGVPDHLLTVDEAAARLQTTRDWLRRNTDALPFVVPLSPGQVRYSARGIERYIASRTHRRR